MGIAIISATPMYTVSSCGHGWPAQRLGGLPNSPLSKIHLISKGFTTPSPDVTTMASPTQATFRRYGLKVPITRRTVLARIGRSSSCAGARMYLPCITMATRIRRACDVIFPWRRGRSSSLDADDRSAGELDRAFEHRVEHLRRQLAGEGVLLARVVRAQQHEGPHRPLGRVAEPTPRPRRMPERRQRTER